MTSLRTSAWEATLTGDTCISNLFSFHTFQAIMLLHRQEGLNRDTAEKVNRTMMAELNIPDHPTAHGSSEAKQFLRVALQLSHTMKVYEVSFVAELMAQFIDGDEEIR